MASIDEIIGYYQETGNFMKTAAKFKMNKRILHLTLAKARVLKINDKIDYGSTNVRFGGLAEKKFSEIFPEAISINDYWVRNHPDYDFNLKKLRIDVKYSSIHIKKKKKKKQVMKNGLLTEIELNINKKIQLISLLYS